MSKSKETAGKKHLLLLLLSLPIVLLLLFLLYVSIYYRAESTALDALKPTSEVSVDRTSSRIFFDGPGKDSALIFYPGAKVEPESYAPLMKQLAEGGMDVFLISMPFRLAFFGINRADPILRNYPEYQHLYIGGHSLGGAMASVYAADHLDQLDGVILLAAYPTTSLKRDGLQVLSFYGSEDRILNTKSFARGRDYMPAAYHEFEIAGGNHAQFGDYGEQKGDGQASITASKQQDLVVREILQTLSIHLP